jgi:hypothetical protein
LPILNPEERIGRTLDGKYKVGLPIASGGMGVVYRGEHTWTHREVAIKVLLPGLSTDPNIARRFLTEARAAATIRHPNVVDVLDMGRDEDGALYMILELLEGRDLDDVLEEKRVLTPDEVIAVMVPVLEGLSHAHAKGFIHRDIKPSNVFLTVDGRGGVVRPRTCSSMLAACNVCRRGTQERRCAPSSREAPERSRREPSAPRPPSSGPRRSLRRASPTFNESILPPVARRPRTPIAYGPWSRIERRRDRRGRAHGWWGSGCSQPWASQRSRPGGSAPIEGGASIEASVELASIPPSSPAPLSSNSCPGTTGGPGSTEAGTHCPETSHVRSRPQTTPSQLREMNIGRRRVSRSTKPVIARITISAPLVEVAVSSTTTRRETSRSSGTTPNEKGISTPAMLPRSTLTGC